MAMATASERLEAPRREKAVFMCTFTQSTPISRILEMSDGDLPSTAQRLVKEWLAQHQDKLKEMWETQQIVKLPPL